MQAKMLAMFFIALLVGVTSVTAQVAGQFGFPISEDQTGSGCSRAGSKIDQHHLEYNTDILPRTKKPINKYHYGEDWNGKCVGDADAYYPLKAIADGYVKSINNIVAPGQGKRLFIEHTFPYIHNDSGYKTVESVYLHVDSPVSSLYKGKKIELGETVAYMGSTGTSNSHLHIQTIWDYKDSGTLVNRYQGTVSVDNALGHIAPSLLIDDRRTVQVHADSRGGWTVFVSADNAPWSTAYYQRGSERKNMREAISSGWINGHYGIIFHENDKWYKYHNDTANYFHKNGVYAYYALFSDVKLCIPTPGHNHLRQRALQDMMAVLSTYQTGLTITPPTDVDTSFEDNIQFWWCKYQDGDGNFEYVFQAVYTRNPLLRFVCYYELETAKWSGWQEVGLNVLY